MKNANGETTTRDLADDLIHLQSHNDFWEEARDDVLLRYFKQGPVLDAGCGAGSMTSLLLKKGFDVHSIDIEQKLVDYTKKINPKTSLCDITTLTKQDIALREFPKFKTMLLADVIEHIENDELALRKANLLLDKRGLLVISVPFSMFFWTQSDVQRDHFRRYSKKELQKKLENSGFVVDKIMLRSFLPILPFLFSKLFHYRIDHETITTSRLNGLLLWYFKNIENRLPTPIGTELICLATKHKEVE